MTAMDNVLFLAFAVLEMLRTQCGNGALRCWLQSIGYSLKHRRMV